MGNYKDLIAFQKADSLAFEIYRITQKFPKDEVFALTSQIRRAALSVPTNIVEGYSRKSKKELANFLNIAIASLDETRYLFEFSKRLGYLDDNTHKIEDLVNETGRVLWSFYKSI